MFTNSLPKSQMPTSAVVVILSYTYRMKGPSCTTRNRTRTKTLSREWKVGWYMYIYMYYVTVSIPFICVFIMVEPNIEETAGLINQIYSTVFTPFNSVCSDCHSLDSSDKGTAQYSREPGKK